MEINIRIATPEDAAALVEIYAPYVKETAITFEYEVPDAAAFARRIACTLERYPYIVAMKDGQAMGYAYAGPFHARPAYDWAVETSVYVRRDCRRAGCGKRLYAALETLLVRQNILNVNACIAYAQEEDARLNNDSIRFHEHMGYTLAGHFHRCGYKFDTWYDMIWMEKMLGAHDVPPEDVIPFARLGEAERRV